MPRPPKPRLVEFLPHVTYFKPAGVPMATLDEVCLGVDELEALRLKDLEGLDQEACAERMNLAQSTFQRLLTSAREKLTRGIVEGKAIRIEGGPYQLVARTLVCPRCGRRWRREAGPEAAMQPDEKAGSAATSETGSAANPPTACPSCGNKGVRPWRPGGPGPNRNRRGRGPEI